MTMDTKINSYLHLATDGVYPFDIVPELRQSFSVIYQNKTPCVTENMRRTAPVFLHERIRK